MEFRLSTLQLPLALMLAASATPALSNVDGTLDTNFDPPLGADPFYGVPGLFDYQVNLGGGGQFTNDDTATTIAAQVDGRTLVGGFAWNNYSGVDQNACVVERFRSDGNVDNTISGTSSDGNILVRYDNGRTVINFDSSAGENDCYLLSLALQGDGKYYAVGNLNDSTHGERALIARFNADSTLDFTFGNASGHAGYIVLDDHTAFSSVVVDTDGEVYAAGHFIQPGFSDNDFYLDVFDAGGTLSYTLTHFFDLGADHDDRVYQAVLVKDISACVVCLLHDELYLLGTANNTPYGDGLTNHDCAIAAYSRSILDTQFNVDTGFNGSGSETIDFPMAPSNEGDNICRAGVPRPAGGLVIGGENYFISTLGGGTPGVASNYALAEVGAGGAVTRQDAFAFFQDLPFPGIYNGIFSMAWQPDGRLLATGYASTGDANHQPSDAGIIRFNADFSRDSTFGNDGDGLAILTLDGLGGLLAHQREWTQALTLDNRGHIVVAGERSVIYGVDNDYDWLVGRLNTSDEIFRDSYDGVVPPVR